MRFKNKVEGNPNLIVNFKNVEAAFLVLTARLTSKIVYIKDLIFHQVKF
ncbi:hypothetical protein [Deferribacter autotrophicus]|nr:hypothetical protein [Deferribacter autotrophicus]